MDRKEKQATQTLRKEKKLKLYVWEGVLCDYTCGMVCVLAKNKAHAMKILEKKMESYSYEKFCTKVKDNDIKARVLSRGAVWVWGGG